MNTQVKQPSEKECRMNPKEQGVFLGLHAFLQVNIEK